MDLEAIERDVLMAEQDWKACEDKDVAHQRMVRAAEALKEYLRDCQDDVGKAKAHELLAKCQTVLTDMKGKVARGPPEAPLHPQGAPRPAVDGSPAYRPGPSTGHPCDDADLRFEDRRSASGANHPHFAPPRQPAQRSGRGVPKRTGPQGRGATGRVQPVISSHRVPLPPPPPPPRCPRSQFGAGAGTKGDEADGAITAEVEGMMMEPGAKWDDVAGLEGPKAMLKEAVVLPLWLPNIFKGIRRPWSGVLLYGPPGTGKTLLANAVAAESGSTFFNVSVSTMTSKNRGESEKLMRALFESARRRAPSVIFFDEIDVFGGQRGASGEHEASRRAKSELLVQMDELTGDTAAQVVVIGATNLPWDLDDALRRRLERRIYIALPGEPERLALFQFAVRKCNPKLLEDVDFHALAQATNGFSCFDINTVCEEAACMPMRAMKKVRSMSEMLQPSARSELEATPLVNSDFQEAVATVLLPCTAEKLAKFTKWETEFGTAMDAPATTDPTPAITFDNLDTWEQAAPDMRGHYTPPTAPDEEFCAPARKNRRRFEGHTEDENDRADVIHRDIMAPGSHAPWSSIAGLTAAKDALEEVVCLPLILKSLFGDGGRRPTTGVLLYGSPGTGKTMLAKALATRAQATFFHVSLASITSKWRGDSEKFLHTLFQMARHYGPSIIFFDEIDALSTHRGAEGEDDASRRVKTQLMTEMNGMPSAARNGTSQILVIGATNHPWDIDDGILRRLVKRIQIPLPGEADREAHFRLELRDVPIEANVNFSELACMTEGYSGHDITCVCRDAAMAKVRRLVAGKTKEDLWQLGCRPRVELPVDMVELVSATRRTCSSVSHAQAGKFIKWLQNIGPTP